MLQGDDVSESVRTMMEDSIKETVAQYTAGDASKEWDLSGLRDHYRGWLCRDTDFQYSEEELASLQRDDVCDFLIQRARGVCESKERHYGSPMMRELERVMMLRVVDEYWMEHLDNMTELRQGIGLRAYGQNDPVVAYKKEGYEMFESMIAAIQAETIRRIFLARVQVGATTVKRERVAKVTGESAGSDGTVKKQPVKKGQKVGRNDPCPCGSGKKYKKCCGMHEDE